MNKYKVIEQVGSGTYGVVCKALNTETNEFVAIKKLHEKCNSVEECMNMAEVKETDLYKLMSNRNKPLSEKTIRDMCFQILQGLAYMHEKGYFHRDLKPENLLVSKKVIKIGDLGHARETNGKPPFTHNNVTTLWYRAPEVFLHAPYYNSAVDMWAMGAIMAELFTLTPLFNGDSEADVMYKMCTVLGTPTEDTWFQGMELAKNMLYKFPEFPGVRFSELLPSASSDAVNLIATLLSWFPCNRPSAMQALQHPFFHSCYRVPPTVRLEDTCFNVMNAVPLVFRMALQRENLKGVRSRSCAESNSKKIDAHSNDDHDPTNMLSQLAFEYY
ncbi:cyclin-dependent kinase F-4-like [Rutidosis leptorrhynchoides]|uniref:cyclin-dependent kinase F-4-like n=1 Tax=Rutidosis leptorrhynchoides TaxID=125765 RepID=UPI003A99CB08